MGYSNGRRNNHVPHREATVTPTDARRIPDPIYERTISRLRVSIGMLAAIELALIARAVVDGLNVASTFAAALTALLLVASLWLWRTGSRLNSGTNASTTGSTRASRADSGHTGKGKTV